MRGYSLKHIGIPFKLMNDEWNNRPDIEFNIPYNDSRKDELEKFLDFVELYPKVRINLEFKNEVNVQHLNVINKAYSNVYVRLKAKDWGAIRELRSNKHKFFFDSEQPAYNLTMLDAYAELGVTDVYIADDLCYNLKETKDRCEKYDIKIRLVLNHIPMTTPGRGYDATSIIFRPNDMNYLKMYFDTFEFDCGKPYDWKKHRVLFMTYFIKQRWEGELSEINPDIRIPLDNRTLSDDFSYYRMNCKRRCDRCNICNNLYLTSERLHDLKIVRKRNKRKEKNELYMTQDKYERVNNRLLSITKDNPEAKKYKEVFDALEIPIVWMAGKATYQLDPCVVIKDDEVRGKTE